jgi:hypothetical protein
LSSKARILGETKRLIKRKAFEEKDTSPTYCRHWIVFPVVERRT